jgi:methionyl-tRNA formyltransferase
MIESDPSQLRIALAGSVSSSRRTLQGLLRNRANVVAVLGLRPENSTGVSGYSRMDDIAQGAGIAYFEFRNINDPDAVETVRSWSPDLLFVVGLSQIVKAELLAIPRLGCVGFHPTRLPEGRGRAPVAWLTLEATPGAATFFLMDEGADSGLILVQEPFDVSERDYAADVMAKLETAIDKALDRWLPELLAGEWNPTPQDHSVATYNGKRSPEDGLIDWRWSASQIHALIRSASRPHPGAYTYANDRKLIIWRAEIELRMRVRGVVGRVIEMDRDKGYLVQTGNGLLWITEVEYLSGDDGAETPKLRVGTKLGYSTEDEVFSLKRRVAHLEERLALLESSNTRSRRK